MLRGPRSFDARLLAGATLVAALLAVSTTQLVGWRRNEEDCSGAKRMFRCLNATRWGGGLSFAHALSAERLPRILRGGTAIDHWQAFGKWTDDYLSSVALDGVVRDVYEQSSSGIFGPFFDPSRPMSVLQHVRPRHNYTKNTMGASTFLRRTHRRQRKLQKKQKRKRQKSRKQHPTTMCI